jgi:hypothetical protein
VPPLQQPFEHVLLLHAHVPLAVSQSPLEQPAQALPPVPHEPLPCEAYCTHLPLESQQPFGQEFASQTHAPATHSWPLAQPPQVAPPVPHDVFVSEA